MLQVWDDGEHTIYNHADERNDLVADWFADRLTTSSRDGMGTMELADRER